MPILQRYREILNKYPDSLKTNFKATEVNHCVVHKIETGSNEPCRAKVRPLLKGSPKAIKGEANWKELERLGIVFPVNLKDCNL